MVWVIAFGELFFGDLWCVVWGYGGMRTHFSLLNPSVTRRSCPLPFYIPKTQKSPGLMTGGFCSLWSLGESNP